MNTTFKSTTAVNATLPERLITPIPIHLFTTIFYVPVGPFLAPVVIRGEFTLKAGMTFSTAGQAITNFGFNSTYNASAGLEYKNAMWSPINTFNYTFAPRMNINNANNAVVLSAKPYVRPKISIFLYGGPELYVDLRPYGKGSVVIDSDPNFEAGIGITGNAGGEVEILSWLHANINFELFDLYYPIWTTPLPLPPLLPTPTFTLNVSRDGTGGGSVTGSGINCPSNCSQSYASSTPVTLTATPDTGSIFFNWSGDCAGTSTSCRVTMDAAKSVTAIFVPAVVPMVTLSVGSSSINEKTGTTSTAVTANLSAASGLEVTVTLLSSGTASSTDFTLSGTTIVIPAGEPSASVILSAVGDTIVEPDETVIIDIDTVINGTELGPQQQIVTINKSTPENSTAADQEAPVNIIFINGIQNTQEDAEKTRKKIEEVLNASVNHNENKKSFCVSSVWNPVGFDGIKEGVSFVQDSMEIFLLKTAEERFAEDFKKVMFPFSQPNKIDMDAAGRVARYIGDMTPGDNSLENDKKITDSDMGYTQFATRALVSGIEQWKPVVVIAHSQGNLLANLAYAKLASKYGDDIAKMIRVINVANNSEFSVNNLNFTHVFDDAVYVGLKNLPNLVSGWTRTAPRCPYDPACNFAVASPTLGISVPGVISFYSHDMVDTYLSDQKVELYDKYENLGITFRPSENRFRDRFEEFVYAAADSLATSSSNTPLPLGCPPANLSDGFVEALGPPVSVLNRTDPSGPEMKGVDKVLPNV